MYQDKQAPRSKTISGKTYVYKGSYRDKSAAVWDAQYIRKGKEHLGAKVINIGVGYAVYFERWTPSRSTKKTRKK